MQGWLGTKGVHVHPCTFAGGSDSLHENTQIISVGARAMAEEPTQRTGLVKLAGLAGLPNSALGKNCVTMDKRLGPPSLVTKDSLHSSS